jgi:hypothetical protein
MTAALPQIRSLGLPHQLHADRVIALMMKYLVTQSAHIRDTLQEIAYNASDGSPKAQRRLEQKLRRAGLVLGHPTVATGLKPGKRGRYVIRLVFWSGYDNSRDCEIAVDDPMPSRPWICLWYAEITGRGHSRVDWERAPLCYVSHHILSRHAQRLGSRTIDEMLLTISKIGLSVLELVKDKSAEQAMNPPPSGWHVPFDDGAKMVLCKHEEKQVLVAVTVLN